MASISAVILKHQQKKDGTWNVKICVNHKSKPRYIETSSFVSKEYLDSKGKLKKSYIDRMLSKTLTDFRDKISILGSRIEYMDSDSIRNYLVSSQNNSDTIDIIAEIKLEVSSLDQKTYYTKVKILETLLTHLKEYYGSPSLNASAITVNFLEKFSKYLLEKPVSIGKNPGRTLARNTVITYMNYFSGVFSRIRKKYNNPSYDYFPLPNNPFEYYQLPTATIPKKRNLTVDQIRKIRDFETIVRSERFALDMFMLSFYLCGINTKDIYIYLTDPNIGNYLEYSRSKVKNRRNDGGVTNVAIPEEAAKLIRKYAGKIQLMYSSHIHMQNGFHRTWKKLSENLGFKCTMYYARHSFGNIARQVCKFSKDDVSFALNHKYGIDITDAYVDPDWSIVHKVQSSVIAVINGDSSQ